MTTWRGSSVWDRETVPTAHGPAYAPQLTSADYRRIWRALRLFQRFKMPTRMEDALLNKMREEQIVRAATMSHGARL